jgi:predicted AlkP superfamily phosphohydrolase/phosphomutase
MTLMLPGCGRSTRQQSAAPRLFVLGVDGLDPKLLQQYVDEGKLSNFKKLLDESGGLHRLRTSIPPQSPVAWSNVAVGGGPGRHGIFDFIHRDPQSMKPELSVSKVSHSESALTIGRLRIPFSKPQVLNQRKGKSFWTVLCENGIPSTICQMPADYPPDCPCHQGELKILSGMGTPDLLGTQGSSSLFSESESHQEDPVGGLDQIHIELQQDHMLTRLDGPDDPYWLDEQGQPSRSSLPLEIWRDKKNDVVRVRISGQEILLKQGEFSEWVSVDFPLLHGLSSVHGMVRLYAAAVHPELALYVSPLNIDPAAPSAEISYPATYSAELAATVGRFYTQNMPPDTKALVHGALSDDDFLKQLDIVFHEERARMLQELADFKSGLLFHYFGSVDQVSHVFWRAIDPQNPLYSSELNSRYGNVIPSYYQKIDSALGEARKILSADVPIIVMSDHGFSAFRWSVNVNTILANAGLLQRLPEQGNASAGLSDIAWPETKAYALGLNGVYLNLRGRESVGSVAPEEYEATVRRVIDVLSNYVDPRNGLHPFHHVRARSEIYRGPYAADGPDIVYGFTDGYRASWETALGGAPSEEIRFNTSAWSGDHSTDDDLVPGVLISTLPVTATQPSLIDIAPTILDYFHLPSPEEMDGRPFDNRKN